MPVGTGCNFQVELDTANKVPAKILQFTRAWGEKWGGKGEVHPLWYIIIWHPPTSNTQFVDTYRIHSFGAAYQVGLAQGHDSLSESI